MPGIDVLRCQDFFGKCGAGAGVVVLGGCDLRERRLRHQQREQDDQREAGMLHFVSPAAPHFTRPMDSRRGYTRKAGCWFRRESLLSWARRSRKIFRNSKPIETTARALSFDWDDDAPLLEAAKETPVDVPSNSERKAGWRRFRGNPFPTPFLPTRSGASSLMGDPEVKYFIGALLVATTQAAKVPHAAKPDR